MKTQEFKKKISELTVEELNAMHKNSTEELFNLKFQLAAAHLEDTSTVRRLKKNIARINTALSSKKGVGDRLQNRSLPPTNLKKQGAKS